MSELLKRIQGSLLRFMQERYGSDELSSALIILGIVLLVIDIFAGLDILAYVTTALLAFVMFRTLSTNVTQRSKERDFYLRLVEKPKKWLGFSQKKWSNRKTTTYFSCENCGASLSVPKGKGKIRVTCPKCHEQSIRKS